MPSEFEEREGNGINEKEEKINIKKEKKYLNSTTSVNTQIYIKINHSTVHTLNTNYYHTYL